MPEPVGREGKGPLEARPAAHRRAALPLWYADQDRDGYGDSSSSRRAMSAPVGYVSRSGDCDDRSFKVHPGVVDDCDGVDSDCDGSVDENGLLWTDVDQDGFGGEPVPGCDLTEDLSAFPGDCDDQDPGRAPGEAEVCDGQDTDCDGQIDDGAACGCDLRVMDGDSLMLCDQPKSWEAAAEFCAERGYEILDIVDADRNAQIRAIAAQRSLGEWWFGLREEQGSWYWWDGSLMHWNDWPAGGPPAVAGPRCAALLPDPAMVSSWTALNCGSARPFLCVAR